MPEEPPTREDSSKLPTLRLRVLVAVPKRQLKDRVTFWMFIRWWML